MGECIPMILFTYTLKTFNSRFNAMPNPVLLVMGTIFQAIVTMLAMLHFDSAISSSLKLMTTHCTDISGCRGRNSLGPMTSSPYSFSINGSPRRLRIPNDPCFVMTTRNRSSHVHCMSAIQYDLNEKLHYSRIIFYNLR